MQVSVENVGSLERCLTISVEAAQIDEKVQKELQSLSRRVKIKGFRAGKVPMKVVEQHYGRDVRSQVLKDVMQSSFYDAITQEKLRPAGAPSFEPVSMEAGKSLEYKATFEVYPEITLADFSSVSLDKPVCEISDSDVDAMLETIRKQHMTWQPAERPAKADDKVTIDFTGTVDGVAFEGGSGTDMAVEIGKGRLIAGFEDGLIGLSNGEEKTLDLTFPEQYQNKELAGKPVQFAVKVKQVEEPVLPALDAELAKKLGVEDGDLDKLRAEVKQNMERELENSLESLQKKAVMDKLLEVNPVDVPQALVASESNALADQMAANLERQGMSQGESRLDPGLFETEAKRRVSLGLIMSEIVKQNDIKADEKAVRAKVEAIAEPYEHADQVVKWYYADKRRLAEVESLVIESQVVDWILGQAKVNEKSLTFNEVMYPKDQA
ncbi:MAG: trigger factor [Gammaproteobacteria bacterium]|jgi:trigger factor